MRPFHPLESRICAQFEFLLWVLVWFLIRVGRHPARHQRAEGVTQELVVCYVFQEVEEDRARLELF